jgi:hypothetical protein
MSHIQPISMKVQTTLSAYRVVTCLTSTANTVKYPAAVSECPIGITTDTVLETGSSIPVAIGGIAKLYFNDTVASGAFVAADSSGRGVPHTSVTAGSYIVGILLGPTIAATGTIAEVLVLPQFKAIP